MPGAGLIARHPQVVPIAATAVAWALLLPALAGPHGYGHGTHAGVPVGPATVVMTVAMMGLLCIPGVRTAAFTSPWRRSHRSVVLCFAGFAGSWVVVAAGMHVTMSSVTQIVPSSQGAALLLIASALALYVPGRKRLAEQCDRPMRIRVNGRAADTDCVQFGAVTAGRCARLCALPMLAMFALPANALVMAGLTALILTDRVFEKRAGLGVAAGYVTLAFVVLA